MAVWIVDPNWYWTTSATLASAAARLALAAQDVAEKLDSDGKGMAGGDPIGTDWGRKYDSVSGPTINGMLLQAEAWSALAGKVYQAGLNHAWAEFRAGRGRIPTPSNIPEQPSVTEPPALTVTSSIGDNGEGLEELLPQLLEEVGVDVPNADYEKLATVGAEWVELSTLLTTLVQEAVRSITTPDPSLPDATAFYAQFVRLNEPAVALAADAAALGTRCLSFSAATIGMRHGIADEVNSAAAFCGVTVGAVVLSTRVGGARVVIPIAKKLIVWRIKQAGRRIYAIVKALRAATADMRNLVAAFQHNLRSLLEQMRLIDLEILDPDGVGSQHYRIPLSKWLAWLRYQNRGGKHDFAQWSGEYDRIKANRIGGERYDNWIRDTFGYDEEHGWISQFGRRREDWDSLPPGFLPTERYWDYADPVNRIVVEIKNGSFGTSQLAVDERALQVGWTVIYHVNPNYILTPSEQALVDRLLDDYPGLFVFNH